MMWKKLIILTVLLFVLGGEAVFAESRGLGEPSVAAANANASPAAQPRRRRGRRHARRRHRGSRRHRRR